MVRDITELTGSNATGGQSQRWYLKRPISGRGDDDEDEDSPRYRIEMPQGITFVVKQVYETGRWPNGKHVHIKAKLLPPHETVQSNGVAVCLTGQSVEVSYVLVTNSDDAKEVGYRHTAIIDSRVRFLA